MKIKIIISLTLFSMVVNGQVRQPHSLYFMETIPQITQMNPALQPRANGYVMLPGVNVDLFSDLAVKDVLQQRGAKWYAPHQKKYDYSKLWESIGKKSAVFNVGADVDLFGFGFRAGNGYFSFGISEHVSVNAALPNDMFRIIDKGTPKPGSSLNFSSLNAQEIAYLQVNIGYSGRVNDRLTIGVNVKPLLGQAAIATKVDKFILYSKEFQWDVDINTNVYSSKLIDEIFLNEKNQVDSVTIRKFDNYGTDDWVKDGINFLNRGIAFDFGMAFKVDERFTVSASLNNVGFISWNDDLKGISSKNAFPFKGLKYDTSQDDGIDDFFTAWADSLLHAIEFRKQRDKFTTMLSPVLHVGASYQLSKAVSVGLLSRSTVWGKSVRQSFNGSFCLQPYSFVAFNAGATWQVKGNVYLGGGFTFLVGPLQVYLLLDHVPVYYSTIRIDKGDEIGEKIPYIPERLKSFTVRTGVNLVFGKQGLANKPMLDKGRSSWN